MSRHELSIVHKRDDMIVHEAEPYNAEPTPAALAASAITPAGVFYSRNHGSVPSIDAASWILRIDGLVDHELSLGLNELKSRFEAVSVTATMQCAGNRRNGLIAVRDIPGEAPWGPRPRPATATWDGVCVWPRCSNAAGPTASRPPTWASRAPDLSPPRPSRPQRFGGSIPLDKAIAGPEVLLAWAMNGRSLEPLHGAPVRVVVPGYIGARSVKWLHRITLSEQPSQNFFQATAYRLLPPEGSPAKGVGIPLAEVALNSSILTPAHGARVEHGRVTVTGYAFAGGARTVARVDVSTDGGASWIQADLGEDQGEWAWRMWRVDLDLQPGEAAITARAWDSAAATQPEHAASVWNPKGYVNNSWPRITLHVT